MRYADAADITLFFRFRHALRFFFAMAYMLDADIMYDADAADIFAPYATPPYAIDTTPPRYCFRRCCRPCRAPARTCYYAFAASCHAAI